MPTEVNLQQFFMILLQKVQPLKNTCIFFLHQDDQRVCLRYGIITKDMEMVCPVDASGRFTSEVTHFKGQYIKV